MKPEEFDVIVVGGRVAGAATALLLARQGWRVALIDRRKRGDDTLSTHALMRAGVLQLSRWGLLERIVEAGTPAVRRAVVHYPGQTDTLTLEPQPGVPSLFAPRRTVLDEVLVDAAIEAGVDVRFRTSLTAISREAGRVTGVRVRTRTGEEQTLRARMTIGADGRRSLVAKGVGARVLRSGQAASATLYRYSRGAGAVDQYEWFYRPGHGAGFIPTNDGLLLAWIGVPESAYRSALRTGLDPSSSRLFAAASADGAARLEALEPASRVLGFGGAPGFQRQAWGPGWALVGDASHFKDPLSAHGMTDALRDAELLAHAVFQSLRESGSEREALSTYQSTRDLLSEELFVITEELASFTWNAQRVRELLIAASRAMRPEIEFLGNLDRTPAAAAA